MKNHLRCLLAAALVAVPATQAAAWAPTQTIELIVPAGAGGGGDQLAHAIADAVVKEHLCPQKIEVKDMALVSGAQGYLYVKNDKKGDSHTLLITLSNLFTLPVARKTAFHWDELTPLARLAMDEFVLWVHADTPYKTAADYVKAAKSANPQLRMGGTGSAQEDQIVTSMLEKASGVKIAYVPLGGGADVAKKLVGKFIDSTVNNPSEADDAWTAKQVRPLGVFDSKRMAFAGGRWKDIPTMKEQGFDVQYLMLRGIFGPPDMPKDAKEYYVELLSKVSKSAAFKKYLKDNALVDSYLTGPKFHEWLVEQDKLHTAMLAGVVTETK